MSKNGAPVLTFPDEMSPSLMNVDWLYIIELPVTVIVTAHHHKEYDQHQEESPGDPIDDGRGDGYGDRVVEGRRCRFLGNSLCR